MPYKVCSFPTFQKDYKNLSATVQSEIENIKKSIIQNPNLGTNLKNNLSEYKKISFGNNPQYRFLYKFEADCKKKVDKEWVCKYDDVPHSEGEIKNCDGLITYAYVRTREAFNNLYNLRKKKLK